MSVLAMSACVPAATALQSSTGDAAPKKPAATTTPRRYQTAAKSSTPAASAKKATTAKSATSTKAASRTHTASAGKRSSRKKSVRARGQQKIDSERAQAIQEALIREHYLSGEATGTWNQASEEAMRRYQADHGWQSKTVPDSRALIKLGLGPSKDHLLNPESAMTTVPDAPRAEPMPTTSHSAAPGTDPTPAKHPNQSDSSSSPQ
ncbi:MAG TPA: peptidoglycan-binding domain-containing protein [Candidatus Sulfotelmatobacter sp.]|nr:peptidoglycan-binding domain-containing protein [Candidatus Sulfotelmatobacter sp.]